MNQRAIARLAKRQAASVVPATLFDPAFPQQWAFVSDPAKLKAIFCTRRAAKSYTAGLYMVYEALTNPGCNCLFIGLTRSSAKNIVWKDILKVINKKHKLNAKFNQAELSMTFPNGSVIRITGIDAEEEEMNKLLGGKYRIVCIDEASMYTVDVRNLVYGVLGPAVADQDGTICMMGTSSNFTRGLFYDITTHQAEGWSLHTWSAHDNPYMAKAWQKKLDEIKSLRPLYMETPQFKQWYLNQWVVDENKLCYRFDAMKNIYDKMPEKLKADGFHFVLGVDVGWEDDSAFVLTCYHENDPNLYVLKTFNKAHMTFDEVSAKIQEFMADPYCAPGRVIIDGSAKQAIETMRVRTRIPFEFADKQGKVDFIEILNADLIQSKIKLHKTCTGLMNEMMSLVWKTDGDKISLPKKEHPALPNHLCDAFLYAWRMGYHYHSTQAKEIIPVGSKEWYQKQSENIWEQERDRLMQQEGQDSPWSNDGFDTGFEPGNGAF